MSDEQPQDASEGSIGQSVSTGGLEPCPFCGNHDRVHVIAYHDCDYVDQNDGLEGFVVICDATGVCGEGGCGAATGWHDTTEAATKAWNRRSNAIAQGREHSERPAGAEG